MRKLAVLVIGLAAMVAATTVPAAAPARDASDLFLRAYLQIQEGDAAFERADYSSAQGRYQDALTILKDVESVQPDWNPHIISFRQRYCEQRINESKVRLAGGTAPATKPSATTPTTIVTTPVITVPAASSRERDLSAEVERLRAQVQRMQIERGTAAPPVTAPPPRTAVTESDRVRQLETELSDMRRQVQQLVGDKSATPPPATMPSGDSQKVMELTDQMGTLRSQLQQLLAERTQWEQSRQELARLQTERSSLLRQLQEKDQRLAAGPTVLESQQLKTTQEQLAQSARTIEAMRSESKQLSLKVAAAEHDARTQAAKVAELTPLSGQLATAKADADKLRIQIAEKDRQIADKSKALETKSLDLARAEDQFKELEKLRKQVAEKNLQIADKTKTLESKSLDLTSAQKNNAELQKTNAQMRIQLSKVEALASLTSGRYKESTEQVGQFKKQLQELKPKLTAAEKKNTKLQELINISGDREKLEQLDSLRHQLDELKPKLADAEKKKTDLQKQVDAAAGDRGKLKQLDSLRQQIDELKPKLADAEKRKSDLQKQVDAAAGDREKLAQLDLLKRQLDELKPKLAEAERKNNELQKLAATATADREKLAQLDTLKRQLDEAERRVGDRTKERATLEKENAVLRATLDQKIAEAKKSSGGTDADRKKVAELEKELKDLKGQMTVLELGARKLSPAEEAFLKQTEVVVRPSQQAISGEISANLRAKERALAQFTALDDAQGIKRPPFVTLAQATSPASPVATDAGGAGGPLAGSAPLGSGQGSSAKMSPELKAYVDEARELYNQKKYEEAAAKYREVLKRDPDNLFGLSNLAVIRFQQERLEEAEHLLNRALQIAPDDGYSHSIIGIIYFKQDRLDDAIAELTRAIKLSPNNSEAHNFLGIACWRKGWRSAAEQELRRALELRPDYADAHYNLAVVYATQKPPFLGLAKFHYRKTLDLGRQRDPSLEKALTGEGGDAKPPEKKPADAKK